MDGIGIQWRHGIRAGLIGAGTGALSVMLIVQIDDFTGQYLPGLVFGVVMAGLRAWELGNWRVRNSWPALFAFAAFSTTAYRMAYEVAYRMVERWGEAITFLAGWMAGILGAAKLVIVWQAVRLGRRSWKQALSVALTGAFCGMLLHLWVNISWFNDFRHGGCVLFVPWQALVAFGLFALEGPKTRPSDA